MKQSRIMSLIEAITNVFVGYGVAVTAQILVFPVFGLQASLAQNLKLGLIFTVISLIRSFALQRLFEAARVRQSPHPRNRHFWTKPCLPVYALYMLPACPPPTCGEIIQ